MRQHADDGIVQEFMLALKELDSTGDASSLADLFADNGEAVSPAVHEPLRGREGAREFWEAHRAAFRHVRSTVRGAIVGDGRAAVEWSSEGDLALGGHVRYDTVTVLELDGGSIRRCRVYYDPAALSPRDGGAARASR